MIRQQGRNFRTRGAYFRVSRENIAPREADGRTLVVFMASAYLYSVFGSA